MIQCSLFRAIITLFTLFITFYVWREQKKLFSLLNELFIENKHENHSLEVSKRKKLFAFNWLLESIFIISL